MKVFILRVAIFCLLCAVLLGTWFMALYRLEVKSYREEVHLPDGVSVVVCGDSHLESDFDTHHWQGSFNFGLSAITLDQLELKVYGVLKANPDFRGTVIVDVSPEKFFNPDVSRPLVEAGSAGKRLMLHLFYPEVNRRPMEGMVKLFRDAILAKRTKKAWKALTQHKPYQSSVGGKGIWDGPLRGPDEVTALEGFVQHADLVERGIKRKAEAINGFPLSVTGVTPAEVISNIVTIIRNHGCRPVLISTPHHGKLLAAIDQEKLQKFDAVMPSLAAGLNVPYISALYWQYHDDCWHDGNHLNARGAILFTRQLKKDVDNVL